MVVLPGDGIGISIPQRAIRYIFLTNLLGPEVVEQALRVLEVISGVCTDVEIKLESHPFGGCAIDATGEPLPESTLKACQEADAILLGESLISSVQCYLGI